MLTEDRALELLGSNAPISKSRLSDRYVFVCMRAEGMINRDIEEEINLDDLDVSDIELDIEVEFFSHV